MPFMTKKQINWACDTIGDLLREWKRLHDENETLKREIQQLERSMTMMRAKMKVSRVENNETYEKLDFTAVCKNDGYPSDGSDENNTFALWTPSANLDMTINNPALFGKFAVGQEFYLDFTLAE
jgi:hypothetical protein